MYTYHLLHHQIISKRNLLWANFDVGSTLHWCQKKSPGGTASQKLSNGVALHALCAEGCIVELHPLLTVSLRHFLWISNGVAARGFSHNRAFWRTHQLHPLEIPGTQSLASQGNNNWIVSGHWLPVAKIFTNKSVRGAYPKEISPQPTSLKPLKPQEDLL